MAAEIIIPILIGIIAILLFIAVKLAKKLSAVSFQKSSLSSRYGKLSEQFMPFLKDYPYNPQHFRFLGSPIDGIQFEDDKIVFVEFKAADSRLSEKQKAIKDLVEKKKVEFREVTMK